MYCSNPHRSCLLDAWNITLFMSICKTFCRSSHSYSSDFFLYHKQQKKPERRSKLYPKNSRTSADFHNQLPHKEKTIFQKVVHQTRNFDSTNTTSCYFTIARFFSRESTYWTNRNRICIIYLSYNYSLKSCKYTNQP